MPLAFPMTFDPESLADEAALLRRLAHQLIPDPQAAEDASQEAVLAFLEKRPANLGSVRAWLIGALRLEREKWFRTSRRRSAADIHGLQIEDRSKRPPDAAARELRERIERETLALREPYRSVVHASLFGDKSLDDIARELDRLPATVRSQHVRGLEILRQRLDRGSGSRRAWVLALLHAPEGEPSIVTAGARGLGPRWGWVAVPLLAVGLWFGLRALDGPGAADATVAVAGRSIRPESAAQPLLASADDAAELGARTPLTLEVPATVPEPAADETHVARVHVVDQEGIGVPGARIASTEFVESPETGEFWIELATTDPRGFAEARIPRKFFRPQPGGGDHALLTAMGEGHSILYSYWLSREAVSGAGEAAETIRMTLGPAQVYMEVRALDGQGVPTPAAEIVTVAEVPLSSTPSTAGVVERPIDGYEFADEHGVARIALAPVTYTVYAWAPSRGMSTHSVELTQSGVLDLPAEACRRVLGRVIDGEGQPIQEANVRMESDRITALIPPNWNSTLTDHEGRFDLMVAPSRSVVLCATHPYDEARTVRHALEPDPEDPSELLLVLAEARPIQVRVVGPGGTPLPGLPVALYVNEAVHQSMKMEFADSEGRARFENHRGQRLSLGVFVDAQMHPPAAVAIDPFVPGEGEFVVVVDDPHPARSDIVGAITMADGEGPARWDLWMGEPAIPQARILTLEAGEEGFTVRDVPPGRLHLILQGKPSYTWNLGVVQVPHGSFLDLGEIRVPSPVPVDFVLDPAGWAAPGDSRMSIHRKTGASFSHLALSLSRLPQEPVALLEGEYFALLVDPEGTERRFDFEVARGERTTVALRR